MIDLLKLRHRAFKEVMWRSQWRFPINEEDITDELIEKYDLDPTDEALREILLEEIKKAKKEYSAE